MPKNNEVLKYSEKDGYYFDIKGNSDCDINDISYNKTTGKYNCVPSYDIGILKRKKFRSIFDYIKYLWVYYYNKYKYEIIIFWIFVGGVLAFSLSFIYYRQIRNYKNYGISFQPELDDSFTKTFTKYFSWLYSISKFVLTYFLMFVVVILGIIFILNYIAQSKPIVWLISFIIVIILTSIYKLGFKNLRIRSIETFYSFFSNPLVEKVFKNTLSFTLAFATMIYVLFKNFIKFGKKNKIQVSIIAICILYFIYKIIFRFIYKRDLYIKNNYDVDYKTNLKQKFNSQKEDIEKKFKQKSKKGNYVRDSSYSYIWKTIGQDSNGGININQILGENLYSNKYKLTKYIEENGVYITEDYINKLKDKINMFEKNEKITNYNKINLIKNIKDYDSKKNESFTPVEIWNILYNDLYKIVNTYHLTKNIDDVEIEEKKHLKTKVLINESKPLFEEFVLKDYPDYSINEANYNFAISSWFFIHEESPNKKENNSKYCTIYNFLNRPHVLYNPFNNIIKIIIKDSNNNNKTYYLDNVIKHQKWNNLLLNFYSNGFLDIFMNGKLILAKGDILITSELSKFKVGQKEGISGGICNVVYFSDTLSKIKIDYFYNYFKNKNPPII